MWTWPDQQQENKAPPVRILILDDSGVLVSSGRNTVSPVNLHCPDCAAVVGENYIQACERNQPPEGSADALAVRALKDVLAGGRPQFRLDYSISKPEAATAWYQIMIFPLEGERRGAMLMQIDVSQRRQSEEDLRRSHEEIRKITGRLINAQEEERHRIARELHDDICQRLAVYALQIGNLRRNVGRNRGALLKRLAQFEREAVEIGNALRSFSHHLHPAGVGKFGLISAVRDFCTDSAARCGVALDLSLGEEPPHLTPETAISLFRIVQEAFANVAKHASAGHVKVSLLIEADKLILRMEDDGVGFAIEGESSNGGFGLISMRERVRHLAGKFQLMSFPGNGTRIYIEIPLAPFLQNQNEAPAYHIG